MKKLLKFIFYSKHSALTIYTIIVVTMAIRLFYQSGKLASDVFNEQMLHRQTIVARIGAHHINDLLEDWGYDLVIFASNISSSHYDSNSMQSDFHNLISKYGNTAVTGGIITNKNGIVIANANRVGVKDLGKNVSDRDYFEWAKNANEGSFFYGKPRISQIGASVGNEVITASTPVVRNNVFQGAITFAVDVREFAQRYLDTLKITDQTRIYLLDKNGNIVYSQYSPLEGVNYIEELNKLEFLNKENSLNKLKVALASNSEGKIIVDLPNQETGELDTFLISHSPVVVRGNTSYTLAVATPVSQSDYFVWPFYNNQFQALVVFTFIILGYAIIEITVVAITNRKSYEKGYIKGKEEHGNE